MAGRSLLNECCLRFGLLGLFQLAMGFSAAAALLK